MAHASQKSSNKTGQSLVQYVIEKITNGVQKGTFAPGQRLIAADLAKEFGVSRAPVREALHVLAGEGVVDLIPNRGAMIRKVSTKELTDLLDFTEAILVLGVRHATPKMNKLKNIKTMEKAMQRIRDAYGKKVPLTLVNAIYEYHVDLNAISGNYYVDFFYRRVPFHLFNPLYAEKLPANKDQWNGFLLGYEKIQAAILSLDPHVSTATFVTHIQWVISIARD
jgi:DNA-binding GntR family transcriptional regulator